MLPDVFQHARQARETGLLAVLGCDGPSAGIANLGALLVTGADAASFLHSQLTNEVNALKPGEGNLSARVTRAGNLVRHFSLHRLPADYQAGQGEHAFLLLLERDGIPSLHADLEKFAIADDVVFENVSTRFEFVAVQGPQAPLILDAALGKRGPESWADTAENSAHLSRDGILAINRSLTGDSGFILAIPDMVDVTQLIGKLRDAPSSMPSVKAPMFLDGRLLGDVLEVLRIEAGIVRMGVDAPEGKLVLPETGLEQQVVSYSKGCYLGQEVIARIRTYGSVPNVLRGIVIEIPEAAERKFEAFTDALERLPPLGADLVMEDGKKAGQIVSRTISPVLDAPIAFAYLDRNHRTPGTRLRLKDKQGSVFVARVELLPFYRAADTQSRVRFLHDRAIRFFAEQKDEKALELLTQALRLDPSFADGYEALGVILGRSGRFNEAIDIFKRLEEVAPNEPMVHTNLSLFYMKLGDKQAAEDEKAKATVKQFSRFGSMKKDEQKAAEDEQRKKADAERKRQMFQEVLEIDAEDPIALFGLGNALAALGEWAGAEQALAKACSVQKDNSAAYLAHGKALEMLNREAEAVEVYLAGMAVASRKGDLMPLKEMERRALLLSAAK